MCVCNPDRSPLRMAIKERSARNSESEANKQSEREFGQAGPA
jgi:hypothetical protein